MSNDNRKTRPPKVAITRAMIEAGKAALDTLTSDEEVEHTDDELVAEVFYQMWQTYWTEIEQVARKKIPGGAVILPLKAKSKLILPPGVN